MSIQSVDEARHCIRVIQAYLREHDDSPHTAEDLKDAILLIVQHALRAAGDAVLLAGREATTDSDND